MGGQQALEQLALMDHHMVKFKAGSLMERLRGAGGGSGLKLGAGKPRARRHSVVSAWQGSRQSAYGGNNPATFDGGVPGKTVSNDWVNGRKSFQPKAAASGAEQASALPVSSFEDCAARFEGIESQLAAVLGMQQQVLAAVSALQKQ
jgi:hypothetical protein